MALVRSSVIERERERDQTAIATYLNMCIWNLLIEVLAEISLVNICQAIENEKARFASYPFLDLSFNVIRRSAWG